MLLPVMLHQGSGAVINVSSLSCLVPIPDFAVYAASKAYVTSFSEALRLELKPHGIPVLAACPGPVPTGFGANARRHDGSRDMPAYEWFRTPREQVVAETLLALAEDRPRVYPGLKTALAAFVISALPLVALRLVLGILPRRHGA
jgi:short-subunit dehydrogenase